MEQIVFTRESSKKLMAMGLHYNEKFLKKLLLARNHARLINNRNTTFYSASPLVSVPLDVKNIIMQELLLHPDMHVDELEDVVNAGRDMRSVIRR